MPPKLQPWQVKRLRQLAVEALPLALVIVSLGLAVFLVVRWPNEAKVRCAGLGLQLVGLVLVLCQIRMRQTAFGEPDLFNRSRNWIRSLCAVFCHTVQETVGTARGRTIAEGRSGFNSPAAPKTLKVRVADLETAIEALRVEATERNAQTSGRLAEIERQIQTGEQARHRAQTGLEGSLRTLAVGDLSIAWAGIILTIFGLFALALPSEIACLLRQLLEATGRS